MADFISDFHKLTGYAPFAWQTGAFQRMRSGERIGQLSLPTGLGKTSLMPIWLLAVAESPEIVPRRLVWVVNRRVVVDQATDDATRLVQALGNSTCDELRERLRRLSSSGTPLAVSTLRGQRVDNREWSEDPSRPAIIVGTVDMVGSRLLFSGYGDGKWRMPLHAGLLGQDALIVNDEAHLTPAFAQLLTSLEKLAGKSGTAKPFWTMRVSATQGETGVRFPESLEADEAGSVEFRKRYRAAKTLHLETEENAQRYEKRILDLATTNAAGRTVVFVRSPEKAAELRNLIAKKTGSERVQLLTGTQRGYERDQLVEHPVFQEFQGVSIPAEPCWLVATSAGEVGVNISADRLVTEHESADHLLQRFGRLNRFGETLGQAHVVYRKQQKDPPAKLEAWKYLESLPKTSDGGYDISPRAIHDQQPPSEAMTPAPAMAPLRPWLLDVWSQTSLGKSPARPKVEPWLHGQTEADLPETELAWRWDVEYLTRDGVDVRDIAEILKRFPVRPAEKLRDNSRRVREKVRLLDGETWCIVLDSAGDVYKRQIKSLEDSEFEYALLLLPKQCCFLTDGMFQPEERTLAQRPDVAEGDDSDRRRLEGDGTEEQEWRRVFTLKVEASPEVEDDEDLVLRYEVKREADLPPVKVALEDHQRDVAHFAGLLAEKLSLGEEITNALKAAALAHDAGKALRVWQEAMGGSVEKPLAKTLKGRPRLLGGFRHELASLAGRDESDLAMHLIASHHGWSRPHFRAEAYDRENLRRSEETALESTRRFARLTKRYGHWGLAYLEAVFKAADALASKQAEEQGDDE